MNKELNIHITNQIDGFVDALFELSDFLTINIHKATILTGSCFFIVRNHRELVSILLDLIILKSKQKLQQTQPIDLINPISCSIPQPITGTCIHSLGLINGEYRGSL